MVIHEMERLATEWAEGNIDETPDGQKMMLLAENLKKYGIEALSPDEQKSFEEQAVQSLEDKSEAAREARDDERIDEYLLRRRENASANKRVIIAELLACANICDENDLIKEANDLTKIAQQLTQES
jgi:hypothetical protein